MHSILVVGAGPTGLMLAAVLARHGVHVRIIDERVQPPEDRSRAIVLQARTLELFRDLGIEAEVESKALHVEGVRLILPSGKRAAIRIRPEWVESRFNGLTSLPQDETERILTELVSRSNVHVERGVTLTAATDRGENVECTLTHADGSTEQLTVDWLVGADGAHSAVRQAAGLSFDGETYNDEAMLGDVDIDWSLSHNEIALCPGGSGFLLVFPLPGEKRFRIIMIQPAAAPPESRALGQDEFVHAMRSLLPRNEPAPVLLNTRWLTRYRLHRRGVPSYRRGRMFVAGDAAHIHSPVGAQGMNTGIQDAYNLGWKIALVARGEAKPSILASYDEERHPVGQKLLKGTDLAFSFLARGGRLARFLRVLMPGIGVRLLTTGAIGKRLARLVSQTAIRYRRSSLCENSAGTTLGSETMPRAGDRLPDAPLSSGQWLHDLVSGPKHFLLVIGPTEPSVADEIVSATRGFASMIVVHRLERNEHTARLAGEEGALYLIRPDKHIGFCGALTDAAALGAYLNRWYVAG